MSSIPLVALNVRPVEQPDVLGNLQRLAQLKALQQNTQQSAQEAPFRQQIMQNDAATGQIDLQQKQMAQKDQQAMSASMSQWDGKSIDDLAPLVIKNGGSANAVMGLKAKSLEMKQQAAKIAADDATTGAKNIETATKKNDIVIGALNSMKDVPDEQLPQALMSKAQELAQQGLLDPQHVQLAQQLAQSGNPATIRPQLDNMAKGMMSFSQALDAAQKQASTAASQANTGKTNAEMDFYKQTGTAPGVSAELQQQADWLKKNPGKGPSDFLLWKQRNSPSAVVMNSNLLAGDQNSQGLDFAAQNYRQTGQMPAGYSRSPQTTSAIIARAAQLDAAEGGQGIAANKSLLTANRTSLNNLQKNFDQVSAFESTANKNLDLYLEKLSQIPDLGAKFSNVPMRMINDKMIGTANYQAMKAAQQTAAAETAKVLSSANASGVLSDSQKKEAEDMLSGNLSYAAAQKVVATLKQDFANRHQSYQAQIGDIQSRVKNTGVSSAAPGQPSGGSSDNFFTQHGGVSH